MNETATRAVDVPYKQKGEENRIFSTATGYFNEYVLGFQVAIGLRRDLPNNAATTVAAAGTCPLFGRSV